MHHRYHAPLIPLQAKHGRGNASANAYGLLRSTKATTKGDNLPLDRTTAVRHATQSIATSVGTHQNTARLVTGMVIVGGTRNAIV